MSPSEFINYFLAFTAETCLPNCDVWKDKWNDNTAWTELMIGKARAETSGSLLGDFITDKRKDLSYRKEDFTFDLAFGKSACSWDAIKTFDDGNPSLKVSWENYLYCDGYEILIEHENNCLLCWEEMFKLVYVRAKLKVLITYAWEEDRAASLNLLVKNFCEIIRRVNHNIKEDPACNYLLLVGPWQQPDVGQSLNWDIFEINHDASFVKQFITHETWRSPEYQ